MAIITISRQFSSNGDEICKKLAERMNYRLVGKEVLRNKMMELGCHESVIMRYDGKKPSFFDNFSRDKDEYLYYLKTAILTEADKNNCVIVGRGAFLVLKEIENCVSFRILEERKLRADRLIKKHPELTEKFALKIIKKADWHQFGFHRSFFKFTIHDHFLYDGSLNSGNGDADSFAAMIEAFTKVKITSEKEEKGSEQLNELLLGQNIVNMLNFTYGIKIDELRADISGKTVTLNGIASSSSEVEQAWKILSLEMPDYEFKSKVRIVQDYMKSNR